MGDTYYDVLGVDPDATRDEIESAYRDRVLETHPDHSDDPDAAERFQRVMTAKSVLTDETERARYDRLGHEAYVDPGDGAAAGSGDASERSATASGQTNARRTSTGNETGATEGRRRAVRERRLGRERPDRTRPADGRPRTADERAMEPRTLPERRVTTHDSGPSAAGNERNGTRRPAGRSTGTRRRVRTPKRPRPRGLRRLRRRTRRTQRSPRKPRTPSTTGTTRSTSSGRGRGSIRLQSSRSAPLRSSIRSSSPRV